MFVAVPLPQNKSQSLAWRLKPNFPLPLAHWKHNSCVMAVFICYLLGVAPQLCGLLNRALWGSWEAKVKRLTYKAFLSTPLLSLVPEK